MKWANLEVDVSSIKYTAQQQPMPQLQKQQSADHMQKNRDDADKKKQQQQATPVIPTLSVTPATKPTPPSSKFANLPPPPAPLTSSASSPSLSTAKSNAAVNAAATATAPEQATRAGGKRSAPTRNPIRERQAMAKAAASMEKPTAVWPVISLFYSTCL